MPCMGAGDLYRRLIGVPGPSRDAGVMMPALTLLADLTRIS